MKIFECGTMVIIKVSGFSAMITAVEIKFDRISYERMVVWCRSGLDARTFK